MILIADCAAVSIFDPKQNVIALVHGGWRGTVGRIIQKSISIMNEVFGCDPSDILVGVGPSIGPCCYEVKEDVISIFQKEFPQQAQHFFVPKGNERIHLDMWTALRYQILGSGIRPDHIEESGICTACHLDEFYSYRAERGKTGRFAGLLVLRSAT